jgi:hypothetical protein
MTLGAAATSKPFEPLRVLVAASERYAAVSVARVVWLLDSLGDASDRAGAVAGSGICAPSRTDHVLITGREASRMLVVKVEILASPLRLVMFDLVLPLGAEGLICSMVLLWQ